MLCARGKAASGAAVAVGVLLGCGAPASGAWMPVAASTVVNLQRSGLVQAAGLKREYARTVDTTGWSQGGGVVARTGFIATPTPTIAGLGVLLSCLTLMRPRRA